jgi:hypothetical protein
MYCSNAKELLTYLLELKQNGIDLENISLSFRTDEDSDIESIGFVSEGIYDSETNSVLEEIIFYTEIE